MYGKPLLQLRATFKSIGKHLAALNDDVARSFDVNRGAADGDIAIAAHDDLGRAGLKRNFVLCRHGDGLGLQVPGKGDQGI